MSEHTPHPEDFNPDEHDLGFPSEGSTPPVKLPEHLEKDLDDALNKPAETPEVLPGKKEYDLTESQASPESMAEVIRQGTPSPEIAEIQVHQKRRITEGQKLSTHPEKAEQEMARAEVHAVMEHHLALFKRITEHEQDAPGWKNERQNIEKTYSTVVRAYNNFQSGKLSASDLASEIRNAQTILDGYDLLLSPDPDKK